MARWRCWSIYREKDLWSSVMLSQGRRQSTWTNAWSKLVRSLVSRWKPGERAKFGMKRSATCGSYVSYTSEEWAKIGRYAVENGPSRATRLFFAVPETIARRLNYEYLQRIRRQCSKLRTQPSWWKSLLMHKVDLFSLAIVSHFVTSSVLGRDWNPPNLKTAKCLSWQICQIFCPPIFLAIRYIPQLSPLMYGFIIQQINLYTLHDRL